MAKDPHATAVLYVAWPKRELLCAFRIEKKNLAGSNWRPQANKSLGAVLRCSAITDCPQVLGHFRLPHQLNNCNRRHYQWVTNFYDLPLILWSLVIWWLLSSSRPKWAAARSALPRSLNSADCSYLLIKIGTLSECYPKSEEVKDWRLPIWSGTVHSVFSRDSSL